MSDAPTWAAIYSPAALPADRRRAVSRLSESSADASVSRESMQRLPSALQQFACFDKFAVIWPEHYRYAVYCSLVDIVYAHAESSADICGVGISVEAAQKAETVYDYVSGRCRYGLPVDSMFFSSESSRVWPLPRWWRML